MNETLQRVYEIGIIPVIAIEDAAQAVPLARALVDGGLPAAEITFRTAAAEDAIRAIVKEVPEMLVGAGTVLTCEQADRAMAAGASFIVAPGYDPNVTQHVIDKGGIMMPGTASAGEMQQAMNQGCETLKFFPAEANGGVAMLKNIGAALKSAKWMCTGGVSAKNVNDYLGYDQIVAVGGTWMCKSDLIKAGKWDEISALCKEAVRTMLGFELAHVGVNCEDEGEAEATAKALGVNTDRLLLASMVICSLTASVIVSYIGIINFIGLIAPHLMRRVIGSDYRYLLPASACMGAILLLLSDTVARLAVQPVVLPIGAITSFLGAPLFLYLIFKGGKRR